MREGTDAHQATRPYILNTTVHSCKVEDDEEADGEGRGEYAMPCYAMLCYAMPCHAMLCYAMLCWILDAYRCSYEQHLIRLLSI